MFLKNFFISKKFLLKILKRYTYLFLILNFLVNSFQYNKSVVGILTINVIIKILFIVVVFIIYPYLNKSFFKSGIILSLLGFALISFIVNICRGDNIYGLKFSLRIFLIVSIIYVGYLISRYKSFDHLEIRNLFIIIFILNVLMQLYGGLKLNIHAYGIKYSLVGIVDNPLTPSYTYVAISPLFVGKRDIMSKIILFLILFFTVMTFRRSSILAIILILFEDILFNIKWNAVYPNIKKLIMLIIIVLGSFVFIKDTRAGKLLQDRFTELNPNYGTGSGRYLFWQYSIDFLGEHVGEIKHLFFGWGHETIAEIIKENIGVRRGSHNIFLDTFINMGIIGISLLLFFYLSLFYLSFKAKHYQNFSFFTIPTILIFMGFATGAGFSSDFLPLYLLLGINLGRL